MSCLTLSGGEASFIQAVENGEPINFRCTTISCDQGQGVEIRAEVLVQILRGEPLLISEDRPRAIRITNAGIHLSGARITGQLNLEDLSGLEGSPLSRLSLEDCWFEKPIQLMRSHLQSLSVRNSRFSMLNASDMRIEGPLDLTGVRGIEQLSGVAGPEKYGQCWVILASAKIGGRVAAPYARLVAPPPRSPSEFLPYSKHARYALDLRASHVESSIILRPDCVAVGGVCLTLATVDGSVWANGLRLKAMEDCAFAADYAVIRGSLYLRPYDLPANGKDKEAPKDDSRASVQPAAHNGTGPPRADTNQPSTRESTCFHAKGCVSLFACKLGGSLYMEGAVLETLKARAEYKTFEDRIVLDVRNAEIGGDCDLSSWRSYSDPTHVSRFTAAGEITLNSMRVKNELSFSGALVTAVDANNIEVGGDCLFSVISHEEQKNPQRFKSEGSVRINGAIIKGDLNFRGACVGAKHGVKRLNPGEETQNEPRKERTVLSLSGSTIGRNCILSTFAYAYEKNNKTCGRGLRFRCNGNIFCTESKITNSLHMDGAKLNAPLDNNEPALDLSGTTVGGDADLKTWHSPEARTSFPFTARGGNVVLKLAGIKIAQKLILNGARISAVPQPDKTETESGKSVYAINAANAAIDGKASLSTFSGKCRRRSMDFRFTAEGKVNFAGATIKLGLDMEGSSLLAAKIDPVTLDLSRAHLRFVSFARDRSNQPFEASGKLSLQYARIDTEMKLLGALLHGPFNAEYARIGTSVILNETTISAKSIDQQLENESSLGHDIKRRKIVKKHIERKLDPDLSLKAGEIGSELIVDRLKVFAQPPIPSFSKCEDLRHGTVDLRGLRVGELQDHGGLGWGSEVRLWLDGFRYERLPEVLLSTRPEPLSLFLKITGMRAWNPSALPKEIDGVAPEQSARSAAELGKESPHRNPGFFWWLYRKVQSGGVWERRLRWLGLQYFTPNSPKMNEYSPDAYEQLVKGLTATGSYDAARRISSARLTLEARLKHGFLRPFWALFRIFFDYGFSVTRAIFTFGLCIALGAWAANIANHGSRSFPGKGSVMILNTGNPETGIVEDGKGGVAVYSMELERPYKGTVKCGENIRPLLYALDVFVPVLDLRQQSVCSIDPAHIRWRYAQAAYAVLGWILTPLTILTITGTLRKHLEK